MRWEFIPLKLHALNAPFRSQVPSGQPVRTRAIADRVPAADIRNLERSDPITAPAIAEHGEQVWVVRNKVLRTISIEVPSWDIIAQVIVNKTSHMHELPS
jgi:hypothetical protein